MSASRACRAAWLVLLISGCSELPGESLGTYKVTMTLEENTCGPVAVFSLDKKRYSVELRSDDQHAYWRIPGQTPIQGRYEAPEFEFEFRAVVASAGPDAGARGCRLVQRDQITGNVITHDADEEDAPDANADGDGGDDEPQDDPDAGTDDPDADQLDASEADDEAGEADASQHGDAGTTLKAVHTMTIAAEPGTDCRAEALMPAGAFERLPCQVRYKLIGLPTKPF